MRSTILASYCTFLCFGVYTHFFKDTPDWLLNESTNEQLKGYFKWAFFALTLSFGTAYYLFGLIIEKSLPINVECIELKKKAWNISFVQVGLFNLTWLFYSVHLLAYCCSLIFIYLTYLRWDSLHKKQLDQLSKDNTQNQILIRVLKIFDKVGLVCSILLLLYAIYKGGEITNAEFIDSAAIGLCAFIFIAIPLIILAVRGNYRELVSRVDAKGNSIYKTE